MVGVVSGGSYRWAENIIIFSELNNNVIQCQCCPGLLGRMPVANATPPLAVLEGRFPGLGAGGVGRPAHCRPTTSLAIVVPFRNREGQLR